MSMTRTAFHSLSACKECGVSGDDFASPNVEAFEVTGELICDDCSDAVLERAAEHAAEDDDHFTPVGVAARRVVDGLAPPISEVAR